MIIIQLEKNSQDRCCGFRIEGHAGFAEHGEDIVCAAVSAIALTAALGWRDVLHMPGDYLNEPGRLHVQLAAEPTAETEVVVQTMVAGLQAIEEQYPDYIQIVD